MDLTTGVPNLCMHLNWLDDPTQKSSKVSKNMQTCFWGSFRILGSKSIKKHYVSHQKLITFCDFAKHWKTVSYTTFWSFQKSDAKYLIKPVVY